MTRSATTTEPTSATGAKPRDACRDDQVVPVAPDGRRGECRVGRRGRGGGAHSPCHQVGDELPVTDGTLIRRRAVGPYGRGVPGAVDPEHLAARQGAALDRRRGAQTSRDGVAFGWYRGDDEEAYGGHDESWTCP